MIWIFAKNFYYENKNRLRFYQNIEYRLYFMLFFLKSLSIGVEIGSRFIIFDMKNHILNLVLKVKDILLDSEQVYDSKHVFPVSSS